MNCRSAQRLLSAERDGAPATSERAALGSHLAGCAECQRFRAVMVEAADAWRVSTARVATPDAELAWQAVRREIRAGGASTMAPSAPWFSRWALPVGAAAALAAVAVIVAPHWRQAPTVPIRTVARADAVEVGGSSSPMVYVDNQSGWLVVWAPDDKDKG